MTHHYARWYESKFKETARRTRRVAALTPYTKRPTPIIPGPLHRALTIAACPAELQRTYYLASRMKTEESLARKWRGQYAWRMMTASQRLWRSAAIVGTMGLTIVNMMGRRKK